MTEPTVRHARFTIERTYPASRERVFRAFSDPTAKAQWFAGPDTWEKPDRKLDFCTGGKESVSGGPPGGPVYHYHGTYEEIVPNERIVTTYEMHLGKTRMSVSLATFEFTPAGAGTRLVLTEQGAFLDGFDKPEWREEGTKGLLDKLGTALDGGIV